MTPINSPIDVEWSTLKLNPFEHPLWIDQARQEVRDGLLCLETKDAYCPEHLLPIFSIIHNCPHNLRILDFGGGIGQAIPYIYTATDSYSVLDGPQNCKMGTQLFYLYDNVEFLDGQPKAGMHYDVVMFNGALHYIEDWRGALVAAAKYTPRWICISRIAVGSPISVFGKQIIDIGFPGHRIGEIYRWIINLEELITTLANISYQLVNSKLIRKTTAQGINDARIPKHLELHTLVFERQDAIHGCNNELDNV